MSVKISIIIPVHNAEPYLKPCLECIAKQTFRDFECICVNDASTDDSCRTIKSFTKHDKRFSVVDIPASGAGAARNRGMELAKGKYFLFLDADDLFAPTMLEKFYARAEETNADIVFCKHQIYEMQKDLMRDCTGVPFPSIDPKVEYPFRTDPALPLQAYAPAPWNKFFRASFVREVGIQFQAIPSANDIGFTTKAKLAARHVASIDEPLVFYRTGQGANITSKVHKDPTCVVRALSDVWEFVERREWTKSVAEKFVAFVYPNFMYTVNMLRDKPEALARFGAFLQGASVFRALLAQASAMKAESSIDGYVSMYLMKTLSAASFAALSARLGERLRKAKSLSGPKVSVVIPCYNAGQALVHTLASVQNQKLTDIEVVVVNDGSQDNSLAIAQGVAANDPRIVVLDLAANSGTYVARKVGTLAAIGKYVTYLDADDELASDASEKLYDIAVKQGADVVHGQMRVQAEANVSSRQTVAMEKMVKPAGLTYTGGDILGACFCGQRYCGNVCAKLFGRLLMQRALIGLADAHLVMAEDLMQFFAFAVGAHKYVPYSGDVYLYHYGRGVTGKADLTPESYRRQCEQVKVLPILHDYVSDRFPGNVAVTNAFKALETRLYRDSYSRIFSFLSTDDDRRKAFGFLLEAATPLRLVSWLASEYFNKRDKFVLAYDRIRPCERMALRPIKTIGILYFHLTMGGVQRVIALLVPIFRKLGYNVVLILEKQLDGTCYPIPKDVRVEVLQHVSGRCGPASIPARLAELKGIVDQCAIDLMYYHPYSSNIMPWDALLCKLVCHIPFVLHFHNCIGTSLYVASQTPEFSYLAARMRTCDHVIALSRTDELYFRSQGIRADYVPNPVDDRLMAAAEDCRCENFSAKTILWVARISWEKHPIDPIIIFSNVRKRMPDAKLVVVGGGSADIAQVMKKKIADEGLEDCVTLAGSQSDVYPFYKKASAFLMTSSFEGFPMTLLEAGLHGLPIVMYELPFLESARDNAGVVQVAQGDTKAAANALCDILSDEGRFRSMSDAVLVRTRELASCDQASTWKEILEALQQPTEGNAYPITIDRGEVRMLLEELQYCYANGFGAKLAKIGQLEKDLKAVHEAVVADELRAKAKEGGGKELAEKNSNAISALAETARRVQSLAREVDSLKRSESYRIGMKVTAIPRLMVRWYRSLLELRKSGGNAR